MIHEPAVRAPVVARARWTRQSSAAPGPAASVSAATSLNVEEPS